MERIVASAIKFLPKEGEYPVIVTERRHCNCFEVIWNSKIDYDKKTCEQGFMTNRSRFVDRYEAAEIAWRARQVLEESDVYQKMYDDYWDNGELTKAYQLFSEDLW